MRLTLSFRTWVKSFAVEVTARTTSEWLVSRWSVAALCVWDTDVIFNKRDRDELTCVFNYLIRVLLHKVHKSQKQFTIIKRISEVKVPKKSLQNNNLRIHEYFFLKIFFHFWGAYPPKKYLRLVKSCIWQWSFYC